MKNMIDNIKKKLHIRHWHEIGIYLMLYDIFAVCFSYFAALWIRFDGRITQIPTEYSTPYRQFILIYAAICVVVFSMFRLYHSIWRFASYSELNRVTWSSIVTTIIHVIGITVFFERMPISYYIFGAVIQFVMIVGLRFSYRFVLLEREKREIYRKRKDAKNVMIIGAGAAGQMILREIMHSHEIEDVAACIIDDNPNKWGRSMEGIPVVGGRDSILYAANKYKIEKIYIAIPSAKAEDKREILNICKDV